MVVRDYSLLSKNAGREKIMATQATGGPAKHQFCADDMNAAGIPVNRFVPKYMRCPSSPLPVMETRRARSPCRATSGSRAVATSTRIRRTTRSAAAARCLASWHQRPQAGLPQHSSRVPVLPQAESSPPAACCRRANTSGIADCTDGTSNTMIVAEQSDWLLDQNPASSKKYHGDPGWTRRRHRAGRRLAVRHATC